MEYDNFTVWNSAIMRFAFTENLFSSLKNKRRKDVILPYYRTIQITTYDDVSLTYDPRTGDDTWLKWAHFEKESTNVYIFYCKCMFS